MDPPPPPVVTSSGGKLRLMCSYGGQILPRPRTNILFYAGGDTRIVSFHRHVLSTLSTFSSHLSSILSFPSPFHLKYQLPHLPLDSLISLSSDEDLNNLVEELHRLNSTPHRIRLFLFPLHSGRPAIRHPKTEAWFFDALKSATIMEGEGGGAIVGPNSECGVGFLSSAAESIVLETSSSFGSTSSSASLTNFPALRGQGCEDNDAVLKDGKPKLTSSDSVPSDNTVSTSTLSYQQSIPYQDPVVHVSEARVNAESMEQESRIVYIPSGVAANNMNMDVGHASFPQFYKVESQHLQFVQAPNHFLPIHPSGVLPVSSCQPIYQQPQPLQQQQMVYYPNQPQPLQQQQMVYYPNQPHPVYLMPIGNMSANSLPVAASGQASLNLNTSFMNCHVTHNPEGGAGPSAQDFAPQYHLTDNVTTSFAHVPYKGNQQPETDTYPMHHQSQNVSNTSRESPKFGNEIDDDLAHVQIYKSQPAPPTLSSKYQTMSKATTNLLSDALAQVHVDSFKQQTETSQPPQ